MAIWLGAASIAVLGLVLYADTLGHPLVFDDLRNIRENAAIRLRSLDASGLWRAAFESPTQRPLANLSFALNHYAAGYELRGYRAVNIGLHIGNALLVLVLGRLLARRAARLAPSPRAAAPVWIGGVAGLLFVAHPLQTQSVTYLVQRMNALAAGFALLSLLLYAVGRRRQGPARWTAWAGAAASLLLGLGSKETAAVAPFAWLLYELYFERDLERRFALRALALAGLGALLLGLGIYWASDGLRDYASQPFGPLERALTELRVVWIYLGLILWPAPERLSLVHDLSLSTSLWRPPTTLLAAGGLLAWLGVALRVASFARLESFGMLWFLLFLALESSFLPLALLYEHRTYLPLAGLCWAGASLAFRWLDRRAALALCAAAIVPLSGATLARNAAWSDPLLLWEDAVRKHPGSWRAQDELGVALAQAGRFEEAERHFAAAVRLAPERAPPRVHLGFERVRRGDLDAGLRELREAIRIDPGYGRAHHAVGLALMGAGRLQEALPSLEEAVRLWPADASMRDSLGLALAGLGRVEQARQQLEAAVALDPEAARAHAHLGALEARAGRPHRAAASLERAVALDPEDGVAANDLAWILATAADPALRAPARALELARRSVAGAPRDAERLDTLAAALAAAGETAEAAGVASRAAEEARAAGAQALAGEIATRAALYAAGGAYREPQGGRP